MTSMVKIQSNTYYGLRLDDDLIANIDFITKGTCKLIKSDPRLSNLNCLALNDDSDKFRYEIFVQEGDWLIHLGDKLWYYVGKKFADVILADVIANPSLWEANSPIEKLVRQLSAINIFSYEFRALEDFLQQNKAPESVLTILMT